MSLFRDLLNERSRDALKILKNYRICFVYPCKNIISSDFTIDELNQVINKLPRGKYADQAGYIREIFISGGKNCRS